MKERYTSFIIFIVVIGVLAIIFVNQTAQERSYTKLQYEYETLKSYLGINPEMLNSLLYKSNLVGRLSFVSTVAADDKTYILVTNTGDIPLSGFELLSGNFFINTVAKPDLLLPGSEGVVAVLTGSLEKPGTLTIKTKQEAMLHINIG